MGESWEKAELEAINLVGEWKPLPERVSRALAPAALKALLKVVKRLRAHGYADLRYKKPDRLKAMELLLRRLRGERTEASQIQDPEILAAESLHVRTLDALRQTEQRREIAQRRLSG